VPILLGERPTRKKDDSQKGLNEVRREDRERRETAGRLKDVLRKRGYQTLFLKETGIPVSVGTISQ